MKRRSACTFCIAAILVAGSLLGQTSKPDSRVKIKGTGVELADIQPGASQCRESKKGMTVTFKVTSTSPIDVRLRITGPAISTVTKDFANQAAGAQISDYMCIPNAEYTVFVRPAGSNQAWPKA